MADPFGTPHIDISEFNETAKLYIDYIADTYSCERDYAAATMAVAMSTALGKKIKLRHGVYNDMGNLWVCLIGKSGVNKSKPSKHILKPIVDIDAKMLEDYQAELKSVEATNNVYRKLNRTKEHIKDPIPMKELPIERAIRLTDTTPEKRNEILANIDKDKDKLGLLCYYDEISQMFNQMGRYNKSSEVQDMLSLFDGSSIKVSRKAEQTKIIREPFFSIFGTIQPGILQETFGKDDMMNNGFNQRWLFVWPQDAMIPEDDGMDREPDQVLDKWWTDTVNAVFRQDFSLIQGTILLTPEASRIYRKWRNNYIHLRNEMDDSPAEQYDSSTIAKLDIMVFHWIVATHYLCRPFDCSTVDKAEMLQAINVMEYFHQSAKNVYEKITEGKDTEVNTVKKPTEREVNVFQKFIEMSKQGKTMAEIATIIGVSKSYISRCVKKCKENDDVVNRVNLLTN